MEVIEVLSELILTFFVDAAYSWFRMSVALVARALPSIEIFCVRMVRGVGFAHQFTSTYKLLLHKKFQRDPLSGRPRCR